MIAAFSYNYVKRPRILMRSGPAGLGRSHSHSMDEGLEAQRNHPKLCPGRTPLPESCSAGQTRGPGEPAGTGLRAAGGSHRGSRSRCSPVKWEQLAVAAEGIATEVDQLQLAEPGQGGQGLQLVLLQVQALQPGPQA